MKIGLVAPLEEPVPPRTYGGTELVVYNLAEELRALGHEVVLFASGDSRISGRTVAVFEKSLRSSPETSDLPVREALKQVGLGRILELVQAEDLDVIHNHLGWRLLPFAKQLPAPVVTTLHGPLSTSHYGQVFSHLPGHPFVSISNSQRRARPDLNYLATVYNGIDCESFEFNSQPDDYLVFLGRFSPEKGPLQAIECAHAAGKRLKLAGKIDLVDRDYWREMIEPRIDGEQIQFVGEVDHREKNALLRGAQAILVPIDWEEPFGLVMVEAMATGTPVIANRRGSVPEIVSAESGFIVETSEEMVQAIRRIPSVDRRKCREYVCRKFGRRAMAEGYLAVYEQLCERARIMIAG